MPGQVRLVRLLVCVLSTGSCTSFSPLNTLHLTVIQTLAVSAEVIATLLCEMRLIFHSFRPLQFAGGSEIYLDFLPSFGNFANEFEQAQPDTALPVKAQQFPALLGYAIPSFAPNLRHSASAKLKTLSLDLSKIAEFGLSIRLDSAVPSRVWDSFKYDDFLG